jgi:hypothetical protein
MAFPVWAPLILVEEYTRLQTEITQRQSSNQSDEEVFTVEDSNSTEKSWPSQHTVHLQEKANVLFRLLTHRDMKSVWASLSRPAVPPLILKDAASYIWITVEYALRDFRILIVHPQTPAQRRKSLLSVASKIKALQEAIAADPFAKAYAKELVAIQLARKNLAFRREAGEILPWYEEERIHLALDVDCGHALENREIRFYDSEKFEWDETPLIWRLGYWAREARDTQLDELLQMMAETLEEESRVSPDIKQPGRGSGALKAFLIRRVSGTLWSLYRQPMDELAAQIITVVLNLQTPLTRDDLRPYLVQPGRKQGKST